jgi:hypothetical protein|tara:strand:- start:7585 stop:8187 length:603 start_codon:yes stop_codon:yes gene_type:complete
MKISVKNYKKKNKSIKHNKKKRNFTKKHYNSGDGMLTSVWGPSMWHYLHIISFNYPLKPTQQQKHKFKTFINSLQYTLPCKYCRINLKNNFKKYPLSDEIFINRHTFSRYIYNIHELINKMLGKKSGLSYCDVRDRYENFRSRCVIDKPKIFNYSKFKKEKGCTTPMYGEKSKCLIKIVPQKSRCKTLTIDKKCLKTKIL